MQDRIEIIREQIRAHPEMSNAQLTDYLNNTMVQVQRRIPMSELHEWANANRIARRFFDENGQVIHPVLKMELEQIIQGKQESVNIHSNAPGVSGLIADMLAAGIVTMEEVMELQALGYEQVSLAQSLGLGHVTWIEVQAAREGM